MNKIIAQRIQQSIDTKKLLLESPELIDTIAGVSQACIFAFRNGKKVLFAGNGGSAADAQHLAAEFSGRFYYDREPLYSEALHVNRDVFFAISTSGNSPNILQAIEEAKRKEMTVVGLTGQSGGRMKDSCDFLINIPSSDTPRIQECHILVGHIICELVEARLFPQ
ncbi:MAG: SIS domain-containing protein [Bacteroidetes bacterium]|nr:SIS domain-containing protein [Bacteroidota bacterium]